MVTEAIFLYVSISLDDACYIDNYDTVTMETPHLPLRRSPLLSPSPAALALSSPKRWGPQTEGGGSKGIGQGEPAYLPLQTQSLFCKLWEDTS